MIKTYPDRAAHDAAAKSETESTVALIENVNKVVIDGVNVVTSQPKVGDIVCYDENRRLRFVELDSYREGVLPSAWETAGIVVIRKGDAVTVMSKDIESLPWCPICVYLVSGFALDGEEHVTTVKRYSNIVADITYSGTTLSEVAEDLKAGFESAAEEFPFDLVFAVEDDAVRITDYGGRSYNALSFSGLSTRTPIKEISLYDRRGYSNLAVVADGYVTSGVPNVAVAADYFKNDIDNDRHNPSADMTGYGDYPVCWPAFAGTSQYQSDHCLWLRQRYCKDPEHPTFDEWKGYIAGQKIVAAMYNGTAPEWRWETAKESVEELKGLTYQDEYGETRPLFPAARKAALAFGGRGYIPSQLEISEAFGEVNYGVGGVTTTDYDPVTRALLAVRGRALDFKLSTIWGAGGSGSVHERYTPGYMDQSYLFNNGQTAVFARYDLSELNDD